MAWTYGFHNSVNGDRKYNAEQMSGIFDGLITQGVYAAVGDKLAVQPNSGMTIQIATGRGWFNSRWVYNTSPYLIQLEESDVLLNRWAAVCIRGDNTDGARTTLPYIKYGEFATNASKPTMERTEKIKEYCLAYVYIAAGVSTITSANIEDTRGNTDLCGWVTGLITQLDSKTLFTQFAALFNEWFSGLKDDIDENTEVMLVDALPTSRTITLSKSGWTSDTQEIALAGMTSTKNIIISANKETLSAYSEAGISVKGQETNKIVFQATGTPTTDIKIDVLYMGK